MSSDEQDPILSDMDWLMEQVEGGDGEIDLDAFLQIVGGNATLDYDYDGGDGGGNGTSAGGNSSSADLLDDVSSIFMSFDDDFLDKITHALDPTGSASGAGGAGGADDMVEFVAEGVLLTGVSLFGLVGNMVAIVVLSRPSMRGSFSTLLIGLSLFDILYLAIGLAIFGLPAVSPEYSRTVYVDILPVAFGFGHIGRVGSVFVTMSVTIERYFAIVHPLKHFSGKRFLLLGSTVAAILYNIPKFYELERKVTTFGTTNTTIVSGSALRSDPMYVTYYIFWSKFILVEAIPYFTILVLNSLIIGKIYKSNQFRKRFVDNEMDPEMTSRQKREANLGVVLISISILFILCQSVKIIPDLYEVVNCRLPGTATGGSVVTCKSNSVVDSLIHISHLLLAINSSANFIIYTWRGEKFREVLTTTFGLHRCLPKRFLGSAATGSASHSTARLANTEMTDITALQTIQPAAAAATALQQSSPGGNHLTLPPWKNGNGTATTGSNSLLARSNNSSPFLGAVGNGGCRAATVLIPARQSPSSSSTTGMPPTKPPRSSQAALRTVVSACDLRDRAAATGSKHPASAATPSGKVFFRSLHKDETLV